MIAQTTTQPRLSSPLGRVMRALPVVGRVIRDVEREVDTIYYVFVILLTAMVLAVQTWGLAALVVTAVAFVPVMFSLLIWITLP
ncbi:hypothetical protein EI545_02505 [Tabrizicola piscis]|uniref:Uncharacterized protein n=1 Tax=Tabrizicola piscis TaxID=2494374 RepID=A0A3S8U2R4_9RHOB|nr:hypothetical protein [Tabrizicola piscis]AZL57809.1 hypothetical protein EI545_02505 [Tabrizicola piscis]